MTVAPLSTVRSLVPNVLVSIPETVSAYVTVKLVVDVPPLAALIVGGAVVTNAVGVTVSTMNVLNEAFAATTFPATSSTWSATRLTVYVPCALADQVAPPAVIV